MKKPYIEIKNVLTEDQCDYILTILGKPKIDAVIGPGGKIKEKIRRTKVKWITPNLDQDVIDQEMYEYWPWLFEELYPHIESAEKEHFKISDREDKIYYLENIQYGLYTSEDSGHYNWHTDKDADVVKKEKELQENPIRKSDGLHGLPDNLKTNYKKKASTLAYNPCDLNGNSEMVHATRHLSFTINLSDKIDYSGGELILKDNDKDWIAPKNRGSMILFNSNILHKVSEVEYGNRYSLVGWTHINEPAAATTFNLYIKDMQKISDKNINKFIGEYTDLVEGANNPVLVQPAGLYFGKTEYGDCIMKPKPLIGKDLQNPKVLCDLVFIGSDGNNDEIKKSILKKRIKFDKIKPILNLITDKTISDLSKGNPHVYKYIYSNLRSTVNWNQFEFDYPGIETPKRIEKLYGGMIIEQNVTDDITMYKLQLITSNISGTYKGNNKKYGEIVGELNHLEDGKNSYFTFSIKDFNENLVGHYFRINDVTRSEGYDFKK